MKSVFEYMDYKQYLKDYVSSQPKGGRGMKALLAQAAKCQTAYISQVFHTHAHLTPEQAQGLSKSLGHKKDETRYFQLLLQLARAGTPDLREDLNDQVEQMRKKYLEPKRKKPKDVTLTPEEQLMYFSLWEHAAVHALLSIEKLRTPDAISRHLDLPLSRVNEIFNFLVSAGLAALENGQYVLGKAQVHLDRESPLVARYHGNWRLQGLRAIDRSHQKNFHYTSVMAISEADVENLKKMLREFIQNTRPLIRNSSEEVAQCLAIDLFPV